MTNREYIAKTWPLHYQRIVEHIYAYNEPEHLRLANIFLDTPYKGRKSDCLSCAFIWSSTTEGWDYWNSLAYRGN